MDSKEEGLKVTIPDIRFQDQSQYAGTSVNEEDTDEVIPEPEDLRSDRKPLPAPIISLSNEKMDEFLTWVDQWIDDLTMDLQNKQKEWSDQEDAYRGKPEARKYIPYEGASNETIPAIAMAVDPIHARLDIGIFKQDPVFKVKPLKKSFAKYYTALSTWIEYYQRHKLKLRQVVSPRLLEMTKLGTMVLKTVYEREESTVKTYDFSTWDVKKVKQLKFAGPKVYGISLGDFLVPTLYQSVHDAPVVFERQRTTFDKLKVAEASGKLTNVDKLKGQESTTRTQLEDAHERASSHESSRRYTDDIEIFEGWCDYDIDGDGQPEHLIITYHKDTRTVLQLRYNWYFHQRKPYTVVPYQLTADSMFGIGIAEMVKPMQEALTKWHQMATDNAYLANIRMFIVKKDSGIEEVPRLYAGRCFFVDDPKSDFIPFAGGDIYPSTLTERQNLFGLIEKRTGVSDYLTGRESPIIGTRATATSTLALIREGTMRVEEVLENARAGLSEVVENCVYIWIQFGTDDLADIVFGDDETGALLTEFFSTVGAENVNGALAIDLTATDASGSRQAMQSMQLQIIQVMMQYLEKLLAAGQGMLAAKQMNPELAQLINDVTKASRQMFRDLLQKYEIRNPDDYLPDLEKYLGNGGQNGAGVAPVGAGLPAGPAGVGGLPVAPRAPVVPWQPVPALPGSGGNSQGGFPVSGAGGGVPQGS